MSGASSSSRKCQPADNRQRQEHRRPDQKPALVEHTAEVRSLAWSSDGKRLCSADGDIISGKPAQIKVWDLETPKETLTLRGHAAEVRCVTLSPDGKRLCSGSFDQAIKVWDLEGGREILSLRGHRGLVFSLALSSDGRS